MANAVVSFIIGLAIILGASILNAAGLNLTKLDHIRNGSSGKKDWQRPLWLVGMLLYILSQLIGSTLALEYMRAEYVAPLGSSSLIFNFLCAKWMIGTEITGNDIWGTAVIVVGVCGIVLFGSINSGIRNEMDVDHLTRLWRRGGWLAYFFVMTGILFTLLIFSGILEAILHGRSILSTPVPPNRTASGSIRQSGSLGMLAKAKIKWDNLMVWLTQHLEVWTSSWSDTQLAWTLGICWSATGGALAGATLVFAKATVKLLSGTLSHQNSGNQFGHAAPIFTLIFLGITAVLQIVCLNRGLKVYDSTLVVPVFYSIYTATGFLNSLIFNDEVDAYKGWTLFLIFVSMVILVSGVVLLTHKKPEGGNRPRARSTASEANVSKSRGSGRSREHLAAGSGDEEQVLWAVGDDSDDEGEERPSKPQQSHTIHYEEDEDVDHHQNPIKQSTYGSIGVNNDGVTDTKPGGEGTRLLDDDEEPLGDGSRPGSAVSLIDVPLSR